MDDLKTMLREFIRGDDHSKAAASRIEGYVVEHHYDDERFSNLLHVLSSYQPGGGEFLFDEGRLLQECRAVLKEIEDDA